MRFGDMMREGWSREKLAAEGWVPIGEYPHREFLRAGFRCRSHEATVYAPGWLVAVRTTHFVQTINAKEYAQVLARLRDEVRRPGGGARRLGRVGGPMRRSKKYPKSTGAWMAERGWADLSGCPRYVRGAVAAAGIPTRWRARLFAPAWVKRVYQTVENALDEPEAPNMLGTPDRATTRTQFTAVLRAVQKDPGAFDPEAALAAYRLGGKAALLGALGAS